MATTVGLERASDVPDNSAQFQWKLWEYRKCVVSFGSFGGDCDLVGGLGVV